MLFIGQPRDAQLKSTRKASPRILEEMMRGRDEFEKSLVVGHAPNFKIIWRVAPTQPKLLGGQIQIFSTKGKFPFIPYFDIFIAFLITNFYGAFGAANFILHNLYFVVLFQL